MYLQYSRFPYLSPFAKCLEGVVQRIQLFLSSVRPPSMDTFISCVNGSLAVVLSLGEEIVIAWTQEKTTTLGVTGPIILHDNARSHTAAVRVLLRRWQWEILEHPPYSSDMSP